MHAVKEAYVLIEKVPWLSSFDCGSSISLSEINSPSTGLLKYTGNRKPKSKNSNNDSVTYYCCICYNLLKKKKYLRRHFYVHTGEYDYECEVCHRCFSNKSKLNDHLSKHYVNNSVSKQSNHPCTMCEKSFTLESSLNVHLYNVHKMYDLPVDFCCKICCRAFYSNLKYKKHIRASRASHSSKKGNANTKKLAQTANGISSQETSESTKCVKCCRSFPTVSSLNVHCYNEHRMLRSHVVYKCDQCQTAFNHSDELAKHCRTHDSLHQFDDSTNKTNSTNAVKTKTKNSCDNPSLKCTKCTKSFTNTTNLNIHCYNAHKMLDTCVSFKCDDCKIAFTTNEHLIGHNSSVHNNKSDNNASENYNPRLPAYHFCSVCSKRFQWPYEVNIHKYNFHHMYDETVTYKCDLCHRAFDKKSSLKRHNTLLHSSNHQTNSHKPSLYPASNKKKINNRVTSNTISPKLISKSASSNLCQLCSKVFKHLSLLKVHQYNHHQMHHVRVPLKCHDCRKGFGRQCDLTRHNNMFHDIKPKVEPPESLSLVNVDQDDDDHSMMNLSLPIIKSEPTIPASLSSIKKRQRSFLCGICDRKFNSKVMLYIHQNDVHKCCLQYQPNFPNASLKSSPKENVSAEVSPPKTRNCSVDQKSQPDANNNAKTYSQNSKFVCHACKKNFKSEIRLRIHKNNIHEIIDPTLRYVCGGNCKKAFDGPAHLSEHMITHNKDHLSICTICGATLPSLKFLRKHISDDKCKASSDNICPIETNLAEETVHTENSLCNESLNASQIISTSTTEPCGKLPYINQITDGSPVLSCRFNPVLSSLLSPVKAPSFSGECPESRSNVIFTPEELLAEEHNYANCMMEIEPLFNEEVNESILSQNSDPCDTDVNNQQCQNNFVSCSFCKRSFTVGISFNMHRRVCLKRLFSIRKSNLHPCYLCEKKCKNRRFLNVHIYNVHRILKNSVKFRCFSCSLAFACKNKLRKHRKICHRVHKSLHYCQLHSRGSLARVCPLCNKLFSSDNILIRHLHHFHCIQLPNKLSDCYLCGLALTA